METRTYWVARFTRGDDPQPKFVAGDSENAMWAAANAVGIALSTSNIEVVTVAAPIDVYALKGPDYCPFSTDHLGRSYFCGEPVIHKSKWYK